MDSSEAHRIFAAARQHQVAGRLREAESLYREILESYPQESSVLHMLAVVAHQSGHNTGAEALVRQAIAIHPADAGLFNTLGIIAKSAGKREQAIAAFRQVVALQPAVPEAHFNLGAILEESDRWDDAAVCYRQALELRPEFVEALTNLGHCLVEAGKSLEAVNDLRRAIALQSDLPDAHHNLGSALLELGRPTEALQEFKRALEIRPRYGQAAWNLAWTYLVTGDFINGWRWYDSRLSMKEVSFGNYSSKPQWSGEALNGRRLLVHGEQGFGDTIQMARLIPMVGARGGRVALVCEPQLKSVLSSVAGVEAVIGLDETLPPFDLHCPLMSLPGRLGITLQTIPSHVPYLHADPTKVRHWARKFAGETRLKVGLVWSGRPKPPHRSIEPQLLDSLGEIAGVRYYGLQLTDSLETAPPPHHIRHLYKL